MLTNQDLRQISEKGISEEKLNNQLEQFKTGFPFLKLKAAAAIGKGICAPKADEQQQGRGPQGGKIRTCIRSRQPHVQGHVCLC